MNVHLRDLAQHLLHAPFDALPAPEQEVIRRLAARTHISRNVRAEQERSLTFGQRLADRVAAFGGSWPFIILFFAFLFAWIALNSLLLLRRHQSFDPYPYILLNLILSMIASIQAPIIMMSQNRQASKDRLDALNDYQVNLKAELEIMALHDKLDALRQQQWTDLLSIQRDQTQKLDVLVERLTSIAPHPGDPSAPPHADG